MRLEEFSDSICLVRWDRVDVAETTTRRERYAVRLPSRIDNRTLRFEYGMPWIDFRSSNISDVWATINGIRGVSKVLYPSIRNIAREEGRELPVGPSRAENCRVWT